MSKEMRKASSLGVMTSLRNSAPDCCSRGEDVHLGAGGVEEDADGERQVLLLGEVLDLLRLFVLEEGAVVLVEVGDVAVFIAHRHVEVDEVDGDLESLGVEAVDLLRSGVAFGWRAAGGWGLLGEEGAGQKEGRSYREAEGGGRAVETHTPLDDRERY